MKKCKHQTLREWVRKTFHLGQAQYNECFHCGNILLVCKEHNGRVYIR